MVLHLLRNCSTRGSLQPLFLWARHFLTSFMYFSRNWRKSSANNPNEKCSNEHASIHVSQIDVRAWKCMSLLSSEKQRLYIFLISKFVNAIKNIVSISGSFIFFINYEIKQELREVGMSIKMPRPLTSDSIVVLGFYVLKIEMQFFMSRYFFW